MIADDDPEQRAEMTFYVESLGFRTRCFRTGEELLGAMLDEPPQTILLDINLPGRSGIRIAELASSLNHAVRICLFSGSVERCDEARGRKLGAVFEKPLSLTTLRHVL